VSVQSAFSRRLKIAQQFHRWEEERKDCSPLSGRLKWYRKISALFSVVRFTDFVSHSYHPSNRAPHAGSPRGVVVESLGYCHSSAKGGLGETLPTFYGRRGCRYLFAFQIVSIEVDPHP
jgi:hypothetical protein